MQSSPSEHIAEPVTDYESKLVMIRAERGDEVEVEGHGQMTVVRRTDPYFGPKLILNGDEHEWLLTAPGPDTQLKLWEPNYLDDGGRYGWIPHSEVRAELATAKKYDMCRCGEPKKTVEHQRLAYLGVGVHG